MSLLTFTDFSFSFPDGTLLFSHQNFTWSGGKLGIVGNNGSGKSTFLKLIHGEIPVKEGMEKSGRTAFLSQRHHPDPHQNILQSLELHSKWEALKRMLSGNGRPEDLEWINDDWDLEFRMMRALETFGLGEQDLYRPIGTLSHGQRVKLWLAAGTQDQADILLLDEPTNHLDAEGRQALYEWVKESSENIMFVSHDRELLNCADQILEIRNREWISFSGCYDQYREWREKEDRRAYNEWTQKLNELENQKRQARKVLEMKRKDQSRGARRNSKGGMSKMMMNTLKNSSEKALGKTMKNQEQALEKAREELDDFRKKMPARTEWIADVPEGDNHSSRVMVQAGDLNFYRNGRSLWKTGLALDWRGNDRIHLTGKNGTGKSTLLHALNGSVVPESGSLRNYARHTSLIDQDFRLINREWTIYENYSRYFNQRPEEGQRRLRLARYGFIGECVFQKAGLLSGGELMRLSLACIMGTDRVTDLLLLDEPDNNLDIFSMDLLAKCLLEYNGCLVVVSHDGSFANSAGLQNEYSLDEYS